MFSMTYEITSGPAHARNAETFATVREAGKRFRELLATNASDIEVLRDGELLDPRLLLSVTAGRRLLRPA